MRAEYAIGMAYALSLVIDCLLLRFLGGWHSPRTWAFAPLRAMVGPVAWAGMGMTDTFYRYEEANRKCQYAKRMGEYVN